MSAWSNYIRHPGQLLARIKASPLAKKFTLGVLWTMFSIVGVRLLGLASSVLVARLLGKIGFGEYSVILNTVNTLTFMASVTLSVTAAKFIAEHRGKDPLLASQFAGLCWMVSFLVGALGSVATYGLAAWLANDFFSVPKLVGLFEIAAVGILFGALNGTQQGMLAGLEAFAVLSWLQMLGGVLTLGFTVVLAHTHGVAGAVAGLTVAQILIWAISVRFLKNRLRAANLRVDWRGVWHQRRALWEFSLPHILGSLLNMPVTWYTNALLVRQPDGLLQISVFSAASRWREVVLFLPGALGRVSAVVYAERIGNEDYRTVRRILLASLGLVGLVCGVASLGIGLAGGYLLDLYGPGFADLGYLTLWLVIADAFLRSIGTPFANIITSAGRTRLGLVVGLVSSAVLVAGAYWLVPRGAEGLAAANLAAAVVALAMYVMFLRLVVRSSSR